MVELMQTRYHIHVVWKLSGLRYLLCAQVLHKWSGREHSFSVYKIEKRLTKTITKNLFGDRVEHKWLRVARKSCESVNGAVHT